MSAAVMDADFQHLITMTSQKLWQDSALWMG